MLHFPVSLLNRRNQTECRFQTLKVHCISEGIPLSDYSSDRFSLHVALFSFMYLVPFQCRVHSLTETQREALDMTETRMIVIKSNSKSRDLASFFGFGRLVLSSVLCREKTK